MNPLLSELIEFGCETYSNDNTAHHFVRLRERMECKLYSLEFHPKLFPMYLLEPEEFHHIHIVPILVAQNKNYRNITMEYFLHKSAKPLFSKIVLMLQLQTT